MHHPYIESATALSGISVSWFVGMNFVFKTTITMILPRLHVTYIIIPPYGKEKLRVHSADKG